MPELPVDVIEHLRQVFAGCNGRTTNKIAMNPNAPEESLDLTWIEHLSRYSSAVTLDSDWVVKVETHYLGGMRQFRRWEIADIGVLVHFRLGHEERSSKVALLQSKRLYPQGTPIREETLVDYEVGFARLADPEDAALSIGFATEFNFTAESRYPQIQPGSDQVAAIDAYEREVELRVYYQLYNPPHVPFTQRVPLSSYDEVDADPELGVRIVPARVVHSLLLADEPLKLVDLDRLEALPQSGWRLEQFICDALLSRREGDRFESVRERRIEALFNRRSGAIAAAIGITIEAPGAVAG